MNLLKTTVACWLRKTPKAPLRNLSFVILAVRVNKSGAAYCRENICFERERQKERHHLFAQNQVSDIHKILKLSKERYLLPTTVKTRAAGQLCSLRIDPLSNGSAWRSKISLFYFSIYLLLYKKARVVYDIDAFIDIKKNVSNLNWVQQITRRSPPTTSAERGKKKNSNSLDLQMSLCQASFCLVWSQENRMEIRLNGRRSATIAFDGRALFRAARTQDRRRAPCPRAFSNLQSPRRWSHLPM